MNKITDIRYLIKNYRKLGIKKNDIVRYSGYSRQFINVLVKQEKPLIKRQEIFLVYGLIKAINEKINSYKDIIQNIEAEKYKLEKINHVLYDIQKNLEMG